MTTMIYRHALPLLLLLTLLAPVPGAGADAPAPPGMPDRPVTPSPGGLIDLAHYHDPELESRQRIITFPERLRDLWLQALARDEVDLRFDAAEAFAQAHRDGMEHFAGVGDALAAQLQREPEANVQLAIIRALDELDHADGADAVFAVLQRHGRRPPQELASTADVPLARWNHAPARELWRDRLASDSPASAAARVSAIRALAAVADTPAADTLLALARDANASPALRLEAAKALGRYVESGLLDAAAGLAEADAVVDRLAAASMLRAHRDADTQALLERLTHDAAGAVVARATEALLERDPLLVAAHAPRLLEHDDPAAREHAMRGLAAQRDAEAVQRIADQLADPAVPVRVLARRTLEDYHGDDALGAEVERHIDRIFATDDWRALEQAAHFAGLVDYPDPAERLVELLAHARPETRLAAAGALRRLALEHTLDGALQALVRITDLNDAGADDPRVVARGGGRDALGYEAAQLAILMGTLRHAPASQTLRRYVPKGSGHASDARSAAVWALGRIYEPPDRNDQALAGTLAGRLSDTHPINPEDDRVRHFAAIALGLMDAEDQLSTLRRFYEQEERNDHIGPPTRWAIIRITGEAPGPLTPAESVRDQWFLAPTRD